MDLMLDRYIGQMLTPSWAEKYLNILMSCLDKQHGSLFVFTDQWIVSCLTTIQQWWATMRPNPISNNSDEYATDTVYTAKLTFGWAPSCLNPQQLA